MLDNETLVKRLVQTLDDPNEQYYGSKIDELGWEVQERLIKKYATYHRGTWYVNEIPIVDIMDDFYKTLDVTSLLNLLNGRV